MDSKAWSVEEREKLRRSFRPDVVAVLFVGESPPANGTFFYCGDSNLYFHTREAFSVASGRRFASSPISFLSFYRQCGCCLDDLSVEPVNRLGGKKRRAQCKSGITGPAERMRLLQPRSVIAVKASIVRQVQRSIREAQCERTTLHALPFPARGYETHFVEGLVKILNILLGESLLSWVATLPTGLDNNGSLR